MSHFGTLAAVIDYLCNLLKIKTFISQKSLDTPVFRLIRFAQKVLTDFQAPLELFSLEEEAALLPGGLFVYAVGLLPQLIFSRLARLLEAALRITRNCLGGSTYHLL